MTPTIFNKTYLTLLRDNITFFYYFEKAIKTSTNRKLKLENK